MTIRELINKLELCSEFKNNSDEEVNVSLGKSEFRIEDIVLDENQNVQIKIDI